MSQTVEIADFGFWALRKVRVFPSGSFDSPASASVRWIASSSTFGITVCAAPKGRFVAYRTSDLHTLVPSTQNFAQEVTNVPSKTVTFHNPQTEIAFLDSDCDGRFFSVATNSPQGPFVHIFDFRLFAQECSDQPFPINSIRLSDDASSTVASVEWNPAIGGMFAAATSNNILATFQVDASQPRNFTIIGKQRLADCVTCISWSPKGKQLVTGHASGKMNQFKPELAPVRHVDAPTNISQFGSAMVKCVALCWVSTTEWLIAYSPLNDLKKVNFSLLTVKKEQPPTWVHMDDVTFGDAKSVFPLVVRMFPIHNWQMVLCASSCSGEVVVIGKVPNTTAWKSWSLEQRFDIPTAIKQNPTCGIGLAMDCSHVKEIIPLVGSTTAIAPSPLLMALTTDGTLVSCWATSKNAAWSPFNASAKPLEAGGPLFNGTAPAGWKPPTPEASTTSGTKPAHPVLTSTPSIASVTQEKTAAEKAAEQEKAERERAAAEKAAAEKAHADRLAAEKAAKEKEAAEKAAAQRAAEKAEAERKAAVEAERRKREQEMAELQALLTANLSLLDKTGTRMEMCRVSCDKAREAADNYDQARVALACANAKDVATYNSDLLSSVAQTAEKIREEIVRMEKARLCLEKLKKMKSIAANHDELDFDEAERMRRTNEAIANLERNFIEIKKKLGTVTNVSTVKGVDTSLASQMEHLSMNGEKVPVPQENLAQIKELSKRIVAYQKRMKSLEDKMLNYECAIASRTNNAEKAKWEGQPLSFFKGLADLGNPNAPCGTGQELVLERVRPQELDKSKAEIAAQRANLRMILEKRAEEELVISQPTFLTGSSSRESKSAAKEESTTQNGSVKSEVSSTDLEKKLRAAASPKTKGVTVGTQSPNFTGLSLMDSPLRDNVKVRRFSTMTFAPRGVSTPLTAAIKEEPAIESKAVPATPLPKENAPIVPSFVTTIQQPPVSQPFKQKLNFSTPAAPATPVSVTPVITKESALFKELISLDDDEKPKAEPVKKEVPVPETTPVVLPPAPVTPKATTTAVPVHDTPKGPTFSTLFGGPAKPVEASTSTAPSVAPAPANPIVTTPTAAPTAVPTTAPASSEAAAPPASTASPSTFSFKPKEPSTGTTATSFSFKPKEPSTGTTPSVFGGFGSSTKPSSLFGGSAIKPAASETAPAAPTSPSAFSFSKPAENKTSLFGKPVATTPASGAVASNNDEGMMEDDAPEATSSAKTGSLFASSGFLSGMGSAVPKGEVKNVFGGAANKPAGAATNSWLFAKSGTTPQQPQQAAQSPSSFSFKPTTNTAGASSFGKATFGGGSSPFSGGSTFGGGASFGAKPAFGGSTTPATGGGFSSFASAGGSGFAKFAQQGNSGFGAAATGASTFGGSTMTPTQASTFGGGTSSSFSNQGASFKGWR